MNSTLKTLGDTMKVVYGHTDSIYVQIESVEKAEKAIKQIESSVREHFPNVLSLPEHPVVLEFEKYYSALGVGTTKNRNAGMITWKDGYYLDEPEFTMTGFTAKRVSETKLAKDVQTDVLKMWASQKPLKEINKYLSNTYHSVLSGTVSIDLIIKRSRLRENRTMVKCPDCNRKYSLRELSTKPIKVCGQHEGRDGTHKCGSSVSSFVTLEGRKPTIGSGIAGIVNAWQNQDIDFEDTYLFMKAKNTGKTYENPITGERKETEYVAGIILSDFLDYTPDWKFYAEQVVKKAEPIYKAMGWDISSIRTGTIQTSLTEWF